ncbi:hypothetical protein HDZ31DRAFT_39057 [Schizophyllum fasciatum]
MRQTSVQAAEADESPFLPAGPPKEEAKDQTLDGQDDDMDAARTLMSPPPEETLRTRHQSTPRSLSITLTASNKRKRTQPDGHMPDSPMAPTTPTAKSRKQRRSQSPTKTLLLSPHAGNPQADYLLATIDGKPRRRSQTPAIPPYEPPPKDSLTPAPKQVFVSPPPPSSSRRRVGHSRPVKAPPKLQMPIKKEMPEIDLNAPIPPASPTDDPLLLRGPSSNKPPRKLVSVGVGAKDTPIDVDAVADEDVPVARTGTYADAEVGPEPSEFQFDVQPPSSLPNSSPPPSSPAPVNIRSSSIPPVFPSLDASPDDVFNDFSTSSADRSMEDDADPAELEALPLPPARPPRPSEVTPAFLATVEGWESSDDETEAEKPGEVSEGESDYTGKWRTLAIRTKRDPPSAATIERMARWGRPISPYPYVRRRSEGGTSIVDESEAHAMDEDEQIAQRQSPSPVLDAPQEHEEMANPEKLQIPDAPTPAASVSAQPPVTPNHHLRSLLRARSRSRTPGPSAMSGQASTPPTARATSLSPLPESSSSAVHEGAATQAQHRPTVPYPAVEDEPRSGDGFHDAPDAEQADSLSAQTSITPPESEHGRATTPAASNARAAAELKDQTPDGWNVVVREPAPIVEDSDDEEASDEDQGPGCVTISSKDSLAAAKCIAILRQHNYDVMIKEAQQKRRRASSTTALYDMSRASHRRNLLESGVKKTRSSKRSPFKKSASFSLLSSPSGGNPWDIGEARGASTPAQWGPGSGSPMSLHDLLSVAEAEAPRCGTPSIGGKRRSTSFVTELGGDGEEDWTKDHWKLLDACFTRERIYVALGGDDSWDPSDANPPLADVDEVDLEKVVDRFCTEAGGDRWHRDALLRRAAALLKKQKAGKVAPPTPSRAFRASSADPSSFLKSALFNSASARLPLPPDNHRFSTPVRSERSIVVPDFTPMSKLPALPRQSEAGSSRHGAGQGARAMSPALFNPRYSHLLKEAKSISRRSADADDEDEEDAAEVNRSLSVEPEEEEEEEAGERRGECIEEEEPEQATGLKRFIYSYLPRSLTPSRRVRPTKQQLTKALPPPPQLPPRGPIETPERPPLSPLVPPKDLVELQQAPPPTKLPRPVNKPRRMVELQHVPTPDQWDRRLFNLRPRERKDSGGSVKDLIKSFEEIDRERKAAAAAKAKAKPAWR